MKNLFAATEAIGNDQCVIASLPDGGEEDALANRLREGVLFLFKAKGTGHSAAAGIDGAHLDAYFAEQRFFDGHFHQGLLMAVAVKENFPGKPRRHEVRSVALQEFAQQESLFSQPLGARVGGKQIAELIAEHGSATGFENNDG